MTTQNRSSKKQNSNEMRNLTIKKIIIDGESVAKTAADLQINRSSVSMIIKKYRDSGAIDKDTQRGCPPKKITPELGEWIEQNMENNPAITLKAMREKCTVEKGMSLSEATLAKFYADTKITLKRSNIIIDRVNDSERITLRSAFANEFLTRASINDSKNIFIDETGFNLHIRRNYGRSLAGARVNVTVPTVRGRNVTLIAAINANGVVFHKIISGSCTSEIFVGFMTELDVHVRDVLNLPNACYYMDNARAHTAGATQQHLTTLSMQSKFLSPYSYMLNPIEYCFSKIKGSVRRLLGNGEHVLADTILQAIREVEEADCQGWYRHIRRNCFLATQEYRFQ